MKSKRIEQLLVSARCNRGEYFMMTKDEAITVLHMASLAITIPHELKKQEKTPSPESIASLRNHYKKLIESLLEQSPAKEHNREDDK